MRFHPDQLGTESTPSLAISVSGKKKFQLNQIKWLVLEFVTGWSNMELALTY